MALPESELRDRISGGHSVVNALRSEIGRAVVGQSALVDRLIVAMLTRGHLLLEGVPGLAKTLVVKTLAAAIEGTFKRIQFTPDLLPADITGTLIFNPNGGGFTPRLGPLFANLVLADEINRAPAKVQSALLEAMQERQVTIGDTSYPLPHPFVVVATQNPIEQEGTYSLPEAQIDRFLMKVVIRYPSREEEGRMLALYLDPVAASPQVRRVISLQQVEELAGLVASVHVDPKISGYIVDLVHTTRAPGQHGLSKLAPHVAFGASPRATLALAHAAKAVALLEGRTYVVPDDVKGVAHDVLRHRILLTFEAAAEEVTSDAVIDEILRVVPVP
jgi:MoxR-like ATPase